MQKETIELITKTVQEDDEIRQKAFLELKENATALEYDIFNSFIKKNRDYKNDNPDEIAYVVSYDLVDIENENSTKDKDDKTKIEEIKFYKYLGFKDIIWLKGKEDGFSTVILKDDIYNYIFEGDPVYPSHYEDRIEFQILKEEFNNIINEARKNEHKKYNAMSYTYTKAIRDK